MVDDGENGSAHVSIHIEAVCVNRNRQNLCTMKVVVRCSIKGQRSCRPPDERSIAHHWHTQQPAHACRRMVQNAH